MLVTPTGLEGAFSPVFIGLYASPGDPAPRVTWPLDGPDASDPSGLPSPLPSFLEACARLAIEAATRGDFARARELMVETITASRGSSIITSAGCAQPKKPSQSTSAQLGGGRGNAPAAAENPRFLAIASNPARWTD